jgi:hypothetical protein
VSLYANFPIAGPISRLFFSRGADTQMQEQALRVSQNDLSGWDLFPPGKRQEDVGNVDVA